MRKNSTSAKTVRRRAVAGAAVAWWLVAVGLFVLLTILFMCDELREVDTVDVVVGLFDVVGRGIESGVSHFV